MLANMVFWAVEKMSQLVGEPKRLVGALALVSLVCIFGSCEDTSTKPPIFKDLGIYQVTATNLDVPSQIETLDTLLVSLRGDTEPSGYLSLSHIEAVRDSFQLELTVWALVREWIGGGPPPPCAGIFSCEYEALPPFYPGYFRVTIHQPDGSVLEDSARVEP